MSETSNIDSKITNHELLVTLMVENHGSPCECATFLRLSTLDQLEKVLTHTHQRKNKDTEHASKILESAREKQRAKFITLAKYDEDITVTRHRLPHSKKRITQEQPAREKAGYIAKGLGSTEQPATIFHTNSGRTFESVLEQLPIKPDKISASALEKLGLAPDDFSSYCTKAQNIYTEAIWKRITHVLSEGVSVFRSKEQGRSSRIMQVQSIDGKFRYILFVNNDTLYTHTTPSRSRPHKIINTSFRVFKSYEELVRSQEHALESLEEKFGEYTEWHIILQHCHGGDKEDYVQLLEEATEYFGKQTGYYPKRIHHYLSQELAKRGSLGYAIRNLHDALIDNKGKREEIGQVYKILAKGREKVIMREVQRMAQIINTLHVTT